MNRWLFWLIQIACIILHVCVWRVTDWGNITVLTYFYLSMLAVQLTVVSYAIYLIVGVKRLERKLAKEG